MQRRASAEQGEPRRVFPLPPLDLRGEVASLHGEFEQRAANDPIRRFFARSGSI